MPLVTERNFSSVMDRLEKPKRLTTDTETDGLRVWHGARMIGCSVAIPPADRDECYYFPFRHLPGGNLSPPHMRQLVRLLSKKIKTFWNSKFDTHILMADGMKEPETAEDCLLLLHLLNENEGKGGCTYELKPAATKYIDPRANRAQLRLTNLLADRGLGKGDMKQLHPGEVEEYANDDVFYTERFREELTPAASEWEINDLWQEINEYAMVTRRMEDRGLMIDPPLVRKFVSECEANMAVLQRKMARMAGWDINPGSNPQLRKWLELPSTAQEYVDQVEWQLQGNIGKGIKLLQKWRKWQKAKGSYYNPMLRNMDADFVCHPNIKLHGTISGRPSSSGTPNWFAIPRQTDEDHRDVYKVKDCVVARKGYTFINAGIAQAELRLGAHYSGDEFNIKCFNEGRSPHRELLAGLTAQGIKMEYDPVKRVSFGIQYGTGAPTLSKELKCDESFARKVLKAAHALHPNYRPMLKQTEELARELGYIRLWTGRIRHFDSLPDPQMWYHKACSNLIQGGIAEVLRVGITRLSRVLPDYDAHMLLQVYDSLLIEVPDENINRVARICNREMTRDFPFSVPMVVEIKVGKRWGNMKELKI